MNNNNNNNNNRMPCSEQEYFNSVGIVSESDDELSFDDTLIRLRDTENDNKSEVTSQYTYVHPHCRYTTVQSLYTFLTSQNAVQKINQA